MPYVITTADIVTRIAHVANRYGDTALSNTPKEFVVVPAEDSAASLQEKDKLVQAALRTENGAGSSHSAPVLDAMGDISKPNGARSHTDLDSGVVTLSANELMRASLKGADAETAMAVTAIHELGHANLSRFDLQRNGARDFKADPTNSSWSNGWERTIPDNVLEAVRLTTGKDSKHDAVGTLYGLVHEAYSDSFAILSIAAKDGAGKGSALAESLREHRAEGVSANGTGVDFHDSTRGLKWLGEYLKTEQGQKLVATLANRAETQGARAESVHHTALKFSTLNVQRWAQDHGASHYQAQSIAKWVGATYSANEASMNARQSSQPVSASAHMPEVFAYDKETISVLSGRKDASSTPKAAAAPVGTQKTMERTMERSR
jgi:hypothetical protein